MSLGSRLFGFGTGLAVLGWLARVRLAWIRRRYCCSRALWVSWINCHLFISRMKGTLHSGNAANTQPVWPTANAPD